MTKKKLPSMISPQSMGENELQIVTKKQKAFNIKPKKITRI
jgi:hypothetical protein